MDVVWFLLGVLVGALIVALVVLILVLYDIRFVVNNPPCPRCRKPVPRNQPYCLSCYASLRWRHRPGLDNKRAFPRRKVFEPPAERTE